VLEKVVVEYITLPGWQSSIASITAYEALPENCRKYVEFIEEYLAVPIRWIGVGPGRAAMIKKEKQPIV
jgi:adenylosuccinate synthase